MKINRSLLLGIVGVFLLLLIGWLAYQLWGLEPHSMETDGFREWLWSERRFDLLLQMVLIFAGTLSIAAILPVNEEDDAGGDDV